MSITCFRLKNGGVTGENDIPTQVLIKLADFYGTSVDYLLGRTDDPTAVEKLLELLKKK